MPRTSRDIMAAQKIEGSLLDCCLELHGAVAGSREVEPEREAWLLVVLLFALLDWREGPSQTMGFGRAVKALVVATIEEYRTKRSLGQADDVTGRA